MRTPEQPRVFIFNRDEMKFKTEDGIWIITPAQQKIIKAIIEGKATSSEIALATSTRKKTVKNQLTNLAQRLGIKHEGEHDGEPVKIPIILTLLQRGILELQPPTGDPTEF